MPQIRMKSCRKDKKTTMNTCLYKLPANKNRSPNVTLDGTWGPGSYTIVGKQ